MSGTPSFTAESISLTGNSYLVTSPNNGYFGLLLEAQYLISTKAVAEQVPNPATLTLFALGLAVLGWKRRKQT